MQGPRQELWGKLFFNQLKRELRDNTEAFLYIGINQKYILQSDLEDTQRVLIPVAHSGNQFNKTSLVAFHCFSLSPYYLPHFFFFSKGSPAK